MDTLQLNVLPELEIPAAGLLTEALFPPSSLSDGPAISSGANAGLINLIARGNAALEKGDGHGVAECLAAARNHPPATGEEALALGALTLNAGDTAEAVGWFNLAVQLEPALAPAHSGRALALQLSGQPAEAQAAAQRALALDATDLVAMKVLARLHLDADQHELARKYCRQILCFNPADKEGLMLLDQCRFDLAKLTGQSLAGAAAPSAPPCAPPPRSEAELKRLLEDLLQTEGFRRLQKAGFHLQRNDYYSPLNDCDFLEANRDLWQGAASPAEIDWRLDEQVEVAREIARFVGELRKVPVHPPEDGSLFAWKNNFWENADALVQYGLVRSRRPARYVEIGCGWSSLLLKQALAQNGKEGSRTQVTLIEPYPNPRLFRHFPPEWTIHRSMIQRAPLAIFEQLEAGDVLFYDGSHCSKVGSDVNWFFFKILPRLKPGVLIHLHDISLPNEYPDPWIFERGQTWNEQYVLQAFLMNNDAYRVLIANRYIFHHRQKELEQLYQSIQPVYGSSFWMEKTGRHHPTAQVPAALAAIPAATPLAEVLQQAAAAFARGDLAAARTHAAAARQHELARGEDALTLGYLALNLGDLPAALECFTAATRLKPGEAFPHSSRALALQLLRRSDEAVREAAAALQLDRGELVALKVLAQIQLNSGRRDEALALCQRILAQQPQDADARRIEREAALTPNPANQPTASPTVSPAASPGKLDGLLGDYSARCATWRSLGVEHLMQQYVVGEFTQPIESYPAPTPLPCGKDGFPVPPTALTMGYGAGDLDHYLACGDTTYQILTGLLRKHQVELGKGDSMLDWGGAAGRVVRKFVNEARNGCEVWGCDVHAPSIQWAQNHLSPPFKFFNSSALPHLPFPDGAFKFIYGMSVMTHLVALRDLWLLELRRVLRPDGCLILTVHNERTWDWFRQHGMPAWMPRELRQLPEMPGESLEIRGSRWEHVYTFFHSTYLHRVWGRHLKICEIVDCADSYQAAVVMKHF